MPKQLYDAFGKTLDRIQNQQDSKAEQGMNVLKWVFLASRQLSVSELRHALSVHPGDKKLDEEGFPSEQSLLDCCLGLVIIDEGTSSIRLVHKSLQDFLKQQYECGALFSEGHRQILCTCLTYLCYPNSDTDGLDDAPFWSDITDLLDRFAFIEYCHRSWDYHAKANNQPPEFWNEAAELLALSTASVLKYHFESNYSGFQCITRRFLRNSTLSYSGFYSIVTKILFEQALIKTFM
jgi:hypothetical protein